MEARACGTGNRDTPKRILFEQKFRASRRRGRSAQLDLFLSVSFSAPHWQQGGIAQLVERQLCKLDVWGSNPHASTRREAVQF